MASERSLVRLYKGADPWAVSGLIPIIDAEQQ
jgi:hypothetical protein